MREAALDEEINFVRKILGEMKGFEPAGYGRIMKELAPPLQIDCGYRHIGRNVALSKEYLKDYLTPA